MAVCEKCKHLEMVLVKTGHLKGETVRHCIKLGRCLAAEQETKKILKTNNKIFVAP